MRIGFTHAYSWPEVRRGGERLLRETSSALARRGHLVTVFTAGDERSTTNVEGVRVVKLRRRITSGPDHEVDFARRVLPRLITGHFDVMHSLGCFDALAGIKAHRLGARHRTVYTNLGIPEREWLRKQPHGRAHEQVVARVDAYGCLSQFALDTLARQFGRRGVLTSGGVNVDRFVPAASRESRPTILYSGAFDEPRKGLATLLEAVARLAKEWPEVRLWLSGPGDPSRVLAGAPPAATDRVEVLPIAEPDDQHLRYGRAWATAVPSEWEAFGLVLLESLACGTPVVAADHAALPELVRPGIGVLAAPRDPESLAAGLDQALHLSQVPATTGACREAAVGHDWREAVVPAYESVYRELIR